MITNKELVDFEDEDGGDNELEIFQIYLQIEPTSLISSMSIEQFKDWLHTDEYGNIKDKPNKDSLQELLKLIHLSPHLKEQTDIVLDLLIKS
jgi:hypothetical protein